MGGEITAIANNFTLSKAVCSKQVKSQTMTSLLTLISIKETTSEKPRQLLKSIRKQQKCITDSVFLAGRRWQTPGNKS